MREQVGRREKQHPDQENLQPHRRQGICRGPSPPNPVVEVVDRDATEPGPATTHG